MYDDQTPEGLEEARRAYEERQEPEEKYTPRPWWHVAMAWVLLAIVVLGIVNICYWQITT